MAFLATVMLAVRTGDSAPIPRTAVLGTSATRDTPTSAEAPAQGGVAGTTKSPRVSIVIGTTSTTLTLETLPAGVPDTANLFPPTTAAPATSTTNTTAARSTTTTTTAPRDVNEQSDNTAEYTWTKDGSGGSSATPDTQPPSDPLTFLVSAHWDSQQAQQGHNNLAQLTAHLNNNTDKPITFPGPDGFALRFLIDRDLNDGKGSQPWRTVEVKRDDIQTLPAHAQIVVIGEVAMDPGAYGTYEVGGEIQVRYS